MCKENIEYAERNIRGMFEKHSRTFVNIMFAYECNEPDHNVSFVVVSAYGSLYEAIWWVKDNVFQVHALNNDSENAFYERGANMKEIYTGTYFECVDIRNKIERETK